jgi:hypothetical protein
MGYPTALNFIIGKLETTPGTAETITSDDFDVRVMNPTWTPNTETDDDAAKYARGDHAEAESVYGARSGTITFDLRLSYGGTDTTEPAYWKYLNACGWKTVEYASGITLQLIKSGDLAPMTIAHYIVDRAASPTAIRTLFSGCMGNAVISVDKIGGVHMAKCTMQGKLVGQTTIANGDIPYPTDMSQLHPEKFLNNTVYVDGKATRISQFTLDPGCGVQPVIDQSDATGYSHFAIVSRNPRLSMNPQVTSLTEDDPIGDIVSGCTGLYAVDRIVMRANRLRYCMPRTQMLPPSVAAREGLEGWDKTYKLMNNGYSGTQGDTGLPTECTAEIGFGFHETGLTWSETGMYM